jgi:predicted phosphate transport protein (TIGR00153 family)
MSILDLFAKSPIKPMQEHMKAVLQCVEEVPRMFEALCAGDHDAVAERARRIDDLEGEADRVKNDLRAHLPRRLFLPVDRRDLLEVLDLQDTIADRAQDLAALVVERRMTVPEPMQDPLLDLVKAVVQTCRQSAAIIQELDELVELGFRGREADRVQYMIEELNRQETESDRLESRVRREVFELESTIPPVTVMMWYQVIEWIGDLADHADKVGNRIRLLIAR